MSDMPITASRLDGVQKRFLEESTEKFNRSLNGGRGIQQTLGKDAFLKILTEQLKNQDPLKPMEDKEFIGQMAQFNSLEQMIQLNKSFEQLNLQQGESQAFGLLGRNVTVALGLDREGNPMFENGLVSAIERSPEGVKVKVNGQQYSLEKVRTISIAE